MKRNNCVHNVGIFEQMQHLEKQPRGRENTHTTSRFRQTQFQSDSAGRRARTFFENAILPRLNGTHEIGTHRNSRLRPDVRTPAINR